MQAVEERVCDQAVLTLLRAMLRAGVMSDGVVRREVTGTPQGGPISPLPAHRHPGSGMIGGSGLVTAVRAVCTAVVVLLAAVLLF